MNLINHHRTDETDKRTGGSMHENGFKNHSALYSAGDARAFRLCGSGRHADARAHEGKTAGDGQHYNPADAAGRPVRHPGGTLQRRGNPDHFLRRTERRKGFPAFLCYNRIRTEAVPQRGASPE